jgi:hypothetical protein
MKIIWPKSQFHVVAEAGGGEEAVAESESDHDRDRAMRAEEVAEPARSRVEVVGAAAVGGASDGDA